MRHHIEIWKRQAGWKVRCTCGFTTLFDSWREALRRANDHLWVEAYDGAHRPL